MDEAALGVAGLGPGIGEQQEQPVEACIRQRPQQHARVVGPQQQVGRQRRVRLATFGDQAGQKRADAVLERLAGDQADVGVGGDLCQRMLAAAEPYLQPQGARALRERRKRIGCQGSEEGQARQRDLQQPLLAGAQLMAPGAAVQPLRRRLQRWKAAFSAGTRSVFSHVKVPFSSSGVRPK